MKYEELSKLSKANRLFSSSAILTSLSEDSAFKYTKEWEEWDYVKNSSLSI